MVLLILLVFVVIVTVTVAVGVVAISFCCQFSVLPSSLASVPFRQVVIVVSGIIITVTTTEFTVAVESAGAAQPPLIHPTSPTVLRLKMKVGSMPK